MKPGLHYFIGLAQNGKKESVREIMDHLTSDVSLSVTRFIDFSLGLVSNEEGIKELEYYLFHGTQIQRNYACLYFNRKVIWKPVKKAYELGLVDEIQAFAK